jgi:DNA repair exonuclease SbcCD ATPase subunit
MFESHEALKILGLKEIEDLSSTISQVNNNLAENLQQIKELKEEMQSLSKKIGTELETEISSLSDTINTEISDLKTCQKSLQNEHKDITNHIDILAKQSPQWLIGLFAIALVVESFIFVVGGYLILNPILTRLSANLSGQKEETIKPRNTMSSPGTKAVKTEAKSSGI